MINNILKFLVIGAVVAGGMYAVREKALQIGCEIGVHMALIAVFPRMNGTIELDEVAELSCIEKLQELR